MEQIRGGVALREGVTELLCRPRRGGMVGDGHVYEPPPVVPKHDEHEQQAEGDRGHDEQVRGHDLARVSSEERPPRL